MTSFRSWEGFSPVPAGLSEQFNPDRRRHHRRRWRERLARWWWRWWWFGWRWRSEHWHGDRRQPRNLHDHRPLRARIWSGWLAVRRPLHRRWRRWWRNAVADVDRDDRPRNGLTARRGANHGTIRRWAVHRCRLIGDLKTRVPHPLQRRVHLQG